MTKYIYTVYYRSVTRAVDCCASRCSRASLSSIEIKVFRVKMVIKCVWYYERPVGREDIPQLVLSMLAPRVKQILEHCVCSM